MAVQHVPMGFKPRSVPAPAPAKADPWAPVVAEYLAAQEERSALKAALERLVSFVAFGEVEKRLEGLRETLKEAVREAGGRGRLW